MNNIISHPIPPVWNSESRILILGTMPSPKSHDFLLRHHLALWDVLASCEITGAADSSIKNAIPNDFTEILENSQIHHIICTGKTAYNLWQKNCAALYEPRHNLTVNCLPSTSPANAQWNKESLIYVYKKEFAILNLL